MDEISWLGPGFSLTMTAVNELLLVYREWNNENLQCFHNHE